MWRHGDVIIEKIKMIPKSSKKVKSNILVKGEITGHSHKIENIAAVQIWDDENIRYFEILAPKANLIHEEHDTIQLTKGKYRIRIQREYTPEEILKIRD